MTNETSPTSSTADNIARSQIVFIENDIQGYEQLIAAVPEGSEVHVLDAAGDGLVQIAAVLDGRSGIGALHIVSHGADGLVRLGTATLDAASVGEHGAAIDSIRLSLAPGGDLLLYGCNIGAGDGGAALLDALHARTGADVAASIDATGSTALGGNWTLERSVGEVGATVAFNAGAAALFQGLLAAPADENFEAYATDSGEIPAPRQLGGFVYGGGAGDYSASVVNSVDYSATVGSGKQMLINNLGAVISYIEIRSISLSDNFKLVSLLFETYGSAYGTSDTYTLAGYNDGVQVAGDTLDVRGSDSSGSVTFTKYAGAAGGMLSFDASWQNIDTIHIISPDGIPVAFIDNIDVSPAIVPPPTITSAFYNAASGTLTFSGTDLVAAVGAANDIVASHFTFTGQGGATYTLSDTPSVEIASSTAFTLVLGAADRAAVVALFDRNGSSSSGGTTYSVAASAFWDAGYTASGAADLTGNGVTVSGISRPTVNSVTLNDSALRIGDSATLTVVFSKAVSGFSAADVTAPNATLGAFSSVDGGTTWSASFTPTAGTTDATNVVSVDATGVVDAAGYAGSGSGSSANYSVDTVAPTATLTVADSALMAGETSLVTVTFSEAVSGFTSADLLVENGAVSGLSSTDGGVTWTGTLTPNTNVADSTNVVTLANAGVADLAGNPGSGSTASNNYSVSTVRPTATLTVADSALQAGETTTLTIAFSEAVSGFSNADLAVQNATLGAVASSDGGVTWTATLQPDANVSDASNLVTLDLTGVANGAGNAGAGSAASNNYAIDTLRPSAAIVVADTALKAGESSLVTVTFSEAVTGFTAADLSLPGGTIGAAVSGDGGVTWTATYTPAANTESSSVAISLDPLLYTDAAGNNGAATATSNSFAVDTARPTATIVVADSALAAGETSLVTITFSEAVSGFSNADLSVANGTLSAVSSADGGITWNATLTPAANVADTTNVITLDNTGVQDAAGNAGAGTTDSNNYAVQTAGPTATITLDDTALKLGDTATVTIAFSEAVSGFTNADLSVENGTLGVVSSIDGGVTWTATFTPDAGVADATNVITLDNTGVTNGAGNAGSGTTTSANYAIDTACPIATVTLAHTALRAGETSLLTVAFSEAVTSLDAADLAVANGTLGALSSADGGVTWTATFTPSANVEDAANVITLDNTGVLDAAGNAGAGTSTSANYAVDTARPTATITVADSVLAAGETSVVTIAFSEAVTGFTNADLAVANGTLGAVASADGGVTWSATFTPAADVADASNVITLDNTGVQDAAGNTGTGTTDSNNYAVQTGRPTASIVLSDTALKAGETALVTVTFSEAVTGFTNADLAVGNGTLDAVSSMDGGVTWTATFTPAADVTDASNTIVLDASGVANVAGNAGTGTASSANYAIDTARPTATITMADSALAAGETSAVTISFSEAVSGFTNTDLAVANGSLSAVTSADGGLTWTATFTPAADVTAASNAITLDNTGVTDAAGNAGTGVTQSNDFAIDTARPTATITLADSALNAGETTQVTIAFSEAVTGFTNADLAVANGALGDVASLDGGVTWSATFTPLAGVSDLTNLVTLDNTGVTDLAGNAGAGATQSANYTVQTVRPTATIALGATALKIGQTMPVAITFSEAVSGFSNADLAVAHGTLSPVASTDGGITWTATFTPGADVSATANLIRIDSTGVINGAGNAGAGPVDSPNYAIDTARPTATVTVGSAALEPGEATSVTIRFSEAVTGFGLEDITAGAGTLSALASADGGITWTAKLTASAVAQPVPSEVRVRTAGVLDAAGNAGAMEAVSNSYTVGGTSIDGVPAVISHLVDPVTGHVIDTVSVPMVGGGRVDDPSSPNRALADIPLGVSGNGKAIGLTVGLPAGVGLFAQGPSMPLSRDQAWLDLDRRIEAMPGSADMAAKAAGFVNGLAAGTVVETKILAPTAAGPALPVLVSGGTPQPGSAIALVIDAAHLAGAGIQLDNVQFAAIAGAATVGGGAGNNVVAGDGAAQALFMGAGDDELHGGGGNDILGGGRSDTGQWQFFIGANGQVTARHETALLAPGNWETVARSELDAHAQALAFLDAPAAKLQDLALLYHAAFGRAADLGGLQFWAANGGSASQVMALFTQQAEFQSGQYARLGDEAFVRALYANVLGREADAPGVAYWTAQLGAKAPVSRADVLTAIALSAEHKAVLGNAGGFALAQGAVTQPAQWFAGSGDDLLDGGAGSDTLIGGDGIDTVAYSGALGQYHLVLGKDGTVRIADSASGDVDTIAGIEHGRFADGTVDLGFTQEKAATLQAVGLLYQSLFDRAGDLAGVGWWAGQHAGALQLAQWMTATAEYQARYAKVDDAAFVQALFANTGLQPGQAGGAAWWTDYLHGHTRAETVAAWIGNAEVIAAQFGGDGLWLV